MDFVIDTEVSAENLKENLIEFKPKNHLYAELAKTEAGLKILNETGHFLIFCDLFQK